MEAIHKSRFSAVHTCWNILYSGVLAYPWLFGLAFVGYYVKAWLSLGRRPVYNQPDPKTLGFDVYHDLLGSGFAILPVSLLAFLTAGIFLLVHRKALWGIGPLFLSLVLMGWIMLLILLASPLLEWYLD